ncbi:hypothetical protein RYX36_017695 [Vicia faba]
MHKLAIVLLKRKRTKVRVGLPKKNPKVLKPAFTIPPKLLQSLVEDPKWDEKGSVIQNYNSFGVVNDPNSLTDSLRAPPAVSDDPNDSGSDLEEDDLKSALGKRRRDGKSALPQPLTSIQGKRRRDGKRTDTKFVLQIQIPGFVTNNERALEELYGDEENNKKAVACLNVMATRVASVFASLREFPFVRFHAARSLDANTMTTLHDLIPTKLAAGVWDSLMKYKKSIPNFPQTETCELLIIDRTIDQIAPLIHEWTYDAMCHDLLNMEGNKYVHEIPGKNGGQPERKEVLLEDHDPIWLELRYAHIADASVRLHEKMTNFISKNKVAQIQHGSRGSGEMSTRDLQKMVQALPQYSEQIDKLSLHVEIYLLLLNASNFEIIAEIIVVCGVGKHRSEKGESSIKALGQKMLMEMKSPLRIDKRKMDALLVKVKLLKSGYVN